MDHHGGSPLALLLLLLGHTTALCECAGRPMLAAFGGP